MKLQLFISCMIIVISAANLTAQWVPTNGPYGGTVHSLLPVSGRLLAGLESWGIRYSTNDGSSWQTTSLRNVSVYSMSTNGSNIYAGTMNNGVFKSTDNGSSWTQTSLTGTSYSVLAVGNTVLSGNNNLGVSRSSNNGLNWVQTNLTNSYVYALAVNGSTFFAGTYSYAGSGAYVSNDNGVTWNQTSLNVEVGSFAVSGSNVYAGTNQGVYMTTNNGLSWTNIGFPGGQTFIASLAITGNNTIIAGSSQGGIFVTTDNGANWIQKSTSSGNCLALSISGVYAGTNSLGIIRSTNNGSDWSTVNLNALSVSPMVSKDNNIFAGGFKSSDAGNSWSNMSINISSITVSGSNLFASGGSQVILSTDDGNSWSAVRNNVSTIFAVTSSGNAVLAGEDSYSLLRSTNNGSSWYGLAPPNVRALGSNGNYVFACTYNTGVYLSSDNGAGFGSVYFPGSRVNCFAAAGNDVYAGTLNTGVLHSSDNGQTWAQTSFNTQKVLGLAANGSNVFAGTSDSGVYFSSNNGTSWTQINEGLGLVGVGSLTIFNGYVYAGTVGYSVWKRPLSELLAVHSLSNEIPMNYRLHQNYPNPFNPSTKIKFDIPSNSGLMNQTPTKLDIYDALGRVVANLVSEVLNPGSYEVQWNASNYPSGVYFYKLVSSDPSTGSGQRFSQTKKLVLIK